MSEIIPEGLGERVQAGEDDSLVDDIRQGEAYGDWRIPDSPPYVERSKRTNVGQESVPAHELADFELGPTTAQRSDR